MSKKNETKNTPAVVEPKAPVAIKINGKTKFEKDSVEAGIIKDVKGREKRIIKVGKSLVSLWLEQGKEINEFIAITEVSMRVASELLGVKRTALNTYCTIAKDPRMLNPEFTDQLENFTQKELIQLTKLDDEEAFDKALEDGHLPKKEVVIDVEVDADGNAEPEADRTWAKELIEIIENSADLATAQDNIANYTPPAEAEDPEPEGETKATPADILAEALEFAGTEDLGEQAEEFELKKSVLKKAIDNPSSMSAKTLKILTDYVNS